MPCNRSGIRRFIGGRERSEDLEKRGRQTGGHVDRQTEESKRRGIPRMEKGRERESWELRESYGGGWSP